MDQLLWIFALLCFLIGAVGTYLTRPALVAIGWVGFAFAALTFIV